MSFGDGNNLASNDGSMLPFTFPLRGIAETWGRAEQPEGTTPDCLNVMPYDLTGRARGGTRPGTYKCGTSTYGGGGTNDANSQWLGQITVEVGTNSAYVPHVSYGLIQPALRYATRTQMSAGRAEFLVLISGGQAYYGTASSALTLIGGAGVKVDRDALVSAATLDGMMYLVDGTTNICKIDFTVDPPLWATYNGATAGGTSPASTQPRLCCIYRKRLIVGGGLGDSQPENFYAARVGDPSDWNYRAPDPGGAFAGNASKGGQPGEPLTALVPLSDDQLLIGCDRSIWLMNGDIADGGQINVLTRGVGMVNQTAACFDPGGNLFFVGTNGYYKMHRGGLAIEPLSDELYPSWFQQPQISAATICIYDKERHGSWIFRTPVPQTTNATPVHLFYDHREKGFFPQQLPLTHGPTVAHLYEHAGNTIARELLYSGYASAGGTNKVELYSFAGTSATDAGTAISSYVWYGPLRPSGSLDRESMLLACTFTLGEAPTGLTSSSQSVTYTLQSGKSAFQAYNAPGFSATGTFATTSGRQSKVRARIRGETFMLKLANSTNNKFWNVDEIGAAFAPGAQVRV